MQFRDKTRQDKLIETDVFPTLSFVSILSPISAISLNNMFHENITCDISFSCPVLRYLLFSHFSVTFNEWFTQIMLIMT
jgi:hypothetical protein